MKTFRVLQLCHDHKGPFIPMCAMYLKGLDSERFVTYTLFLRGDGSQDIEKALAGSEVYFLGLKAAALRGLKLKAVARVAAFCRHEKIDLVIAHRYKAIYIAGLASLFTPVKVWGVAHGHDVFKRLGRRFLLQSIRPDIKVIGVSDTVVNDVLKACPDLQGRKRVFSLPNCLDEGLEPQLLSRQRARARLGLAEQSYIFGTVGRLVDSKSQHLLLHALASSGLDHCVVVMIGDGPEQERLQQLAESLGIAGRVVFAGNIDQAFMLIPAFDVFVFPSNEKEGFGLVLLEAMMARVPIISSNSAGPEEVVADTGLIFPMGDTNALAAAMKDVYQLTETKREDLIERAYRRWKKCYSSSGFRRRFLALLFPEDSSC